MNKLRIFSLFFTFAALTLPAHADSLTRQLPKPDTTAGQPLMETMQNRRSEKVFSEKAIDEQTLSEILWSAWGINRPDGKRTVPTSMNVQNMRVYAVMADGTWLYDAAKNKITQVNKDDLRPLFAKQSYAENAPLFLLYTTNGSGEAVTSALHAGSMYQNVALYSASKGLNNVVRSYFDKAGVAKALTLDEENIVVSQVVGWPQ